jgi:hypothetical protein
MVSEKITGIAKWFVEMEKNGNIYFSACQVVFVRRILHRTDLTQVLLGFVVIPQSLAKFQSLPEQSPTRSELFLNPLVVRKVQSVQFHLQKLFHADESVAGVHWGFP